MSVLRPFRALRADASRIDPGALVFCDTDVDAASEDPRNLRHALRARPAAGDSEEAVATRARFRLAELVRAGLLRREPTAALYALRAVDGEQSMLGFFAAVHRASSAVAGATDPAFVDAVAIGDATTVAFTDKKGRVARSLETETEREPDVTVDRGGRSFSLWVIDDQTTTERVTALVEGGEPRVTSAIAAVADGFGLGFFVDAAQPSFPVPVGLVLLPRTDRF
jgi:hypothetical protein